MALISDIVKELALSTGTAEKSITVIARWLREDGLLSQKGHGRGAAQATPLDAARLLIALMIGGKIKNAPQAVRDFGQLLEEPHSRGGGDQEMSLENLCGLTDGHTFEDGLAAVIGFWGNEDAMRAMRKYINLRGELGVFFASLHSNHIFGSIQSLLVTYDYRHPTVHSSTAEPDQRPEPSSNDSLAAWDEVVARYQYGIESQRTVSDTLLRPLGAVVADLREPGSMQLRGERIAKTRDEITIIHEKRKRIAKASAVIKEKLERRKRKKAANTIQKENAALESEVETEAGWRPDTRVPDGKGGGGDG